MRITIPILIILATTQISGYAQGMSKFEAIAQSVLNQQAAAWNIGDLDAFMETYWKSPDLQFISKNGMASGWEATRTRYYRTYPDRKAMGHLDFELIRVDKRTKNLMTVIGKYHVKREELEDLAGTFVLILQRIHRNWSITLDSTH